MSDVRSLYSPGRKFFRQVGRGYREDKLDRLLFRGVIQAVDRLGSDERPRFSVLVKVIGYDGPTDKTDGHWFPPLLPIQQIALPEVGEEVFLICEEIGNINSAFWIARNVTQNTLTKNEIGAGLVGQIDQQNQDSSSQFGYTGKPPVENGDTSPDNAYQIPDPRVKPGDTITQGRSNTFSRHTFDTKNLKGVVETITEEQTVPDSTFYKDDFRSSSGAREVYATKSDLDTQIVEQIDGLKFDASYLAGTDPGSAALQNAGYPTYDKPFAIDGIDTATRAQNKYDTAYLLLEALELRIVSRKGKNVQHTVLAEEQERWLILLINLIKDLIEDVNLFRDHTDQYRKAVDDFRKNVFELHVHMGNGPTSAPLDPQKSLSTGAFADSLSTAHTNFETDKSNLTTDEGDFEKHKKPIPIHHSKTVAIN